MVLKRAAYYWTTFRIEHSRSLRLQCYRPGCRGLGVQFHLLANQRANLTQWWAPSPSSLVKLVIHKLRLSVTATKKNFCAACTVHWTVSTAHSTDHFVYLPLCIKVFILGDILFLKKVSHDKLLMGRPMSELRDVTCHMGSHSFTCHPTHVNAPRLNPSQ